ncbi:hypothetical protein LIER_07831 [Lithospermum erythrorhizon]|uniref:Uncharacterized protein n=1 Tax=Lithospermum erythrorhizon TaxID=34254 RepID=A0AAV3PBB7_LITER
MKKEKALVPSKVNYKAIVTGKTLINQLLGQKKTAMAPKEPKFKDPRPTVVPPVSGTPDLVSQEVESIALLDLTMDELRILPLGSCGSPLTTRDSPRHTFVGHPSVSRGDLSPASSPNDLPISFGKGDQSGLCHVPEVTESHCRCRRARTARKFTEANKGRERLALAEKNRALGKYKELMTSHAASEGKLMAEVDILSSSLESAKADLERVKTYLQESVLEKEALSVELSEAERSAFVVVETFKGSDDYRELLKNNTATLVRGFYQGVSSDFPGIAAHFKKYVTDLGDEYVTDLFEDLPDEDEEDEGDEMFLAPTKSKMKTVTSRPR